MNLTHTPQTKESSFVVTLADLCEALEDGRLESQRNDEYYTIRQGDLRRFAQSAKIRHLDLPRTVVDHLYAAG